MGRQRERERERERERYDSIQYTRVKDGVAMGCWEAGELGSGAGEEAFVLLPSSDRHAPFSPDPCRFGVV